MTKIPNTVPTPIPHRVKRWTMDWVRFWWYKVPEPRWISVVTTLAYVVFALTGYATLVNPPSTLSAAYGEFAMSLVGVFFIIGSFGGMIAGARDYWELERWGIAAMLVGLGTYFYIVGQLQLTESGSRLTQLGVILIAILFLCMRMLMVWRYPYKPRS